MLHIFVNVLQFRWSPVHLAAYNGQLQAVTVLIQRYSCQPDLKEKVRGIVFDQILQGIQMKSQSNKCFGDVVSL